MGTNLKPLLISKEINLDSLSGKKLAVDSYNMLYQFLTTIRQQDGSPLTNSKGKITSHLSGLFFRATNLMRHNIRLAFVFDGKPPVLKEEERQRRAELKKDAERKYQEALDEGDIEMMRKYAGRTARLTGEMIEDAKQLISALGLPIIEAPSEGEAQAAFMAGSCGFYALLSQDTDGLIFGSPRIVKNLSISKKKKVPGTSAYKESLPELIDLGENLNLLGIDIDQLIAVSMLVGTDFNVGGIKGIGPKKALALIKRHGRNFEEAFREAGWGAAFPMPWEDVYNTIKKIPVKEPGQISWGQPDARKINMIMVEENEFSSERIDSVLREITKKQAQKGLSDFF